LSPSDGTHGVGRSRRRGAESLRSVLDSPRARNLALQWLARREHSSVELHNKLLEKGCASDVAAQVVGRLKAERLLSDERFVEALVAARRRRGQGPLRVEQELEKKGIPKDLAAQWLDSRGRDWITLLKDVRRKKFGTKQPESYAERAKQARFLRYRGFTPDQIRQVLNVSDVDD